MRRPTPKIVNPRENRDFITNPFQQYPFQPTTTQYPYQQTTNATFGLSSPPPNFPQPAQQQQPVVLATGSLDEFFNQPSVGGGPSWSFKDKPIGTSYVGVVARPITNADIQQQTQPGSGAPATYRNGQPKWVMRVPMLVAADQSFPDGEASWYVTGQSRDELVRAMAEAGAPQGAPEVGATIHVTLVARRPSRTPGFNPSNQVSVRYVRPEVVEPAHDAGQPASGVGTAVPSTAQATPDAPQAPLPPGDLTPEQQALLARLGQRAA